LILERLGGMLEATHARPRLVLAEHPSDERRDAFWIVGGRLVDWGPMPDLDELERRTEAALARGGRIGELGTHVPPDEVDEVRIVAAWLASHPESPRLVLEPKPARPTLEAFVAKQPAESALH
jgi:hypothetical protein